MSRRKSRLSEENHPTREDDSRFDEVWQPPALLDAPPARDGMRQRWVATSILGSEVPHHTMRRFREGWTPRPADTVPTSFPVYASYQKIGHRHGKGTLSIKQENLMNSWKVRFKKRNEQEASLYEGKLIVLFHMENV